VTIEASAAVDVKHEERRWQDAEGGQLQIQAYARPGTRLVLEQQFSRVARALRLEPGQRLLDIGCGVGNFLAWLRGQHAGLRHGLDLSLNSLRHARVVCDGAQLAVGDAERLPYRDRAFERVVCNGAAHHFLEPLVAFREIFRVLAPGGIVVMYEPTATMLTGLLRRLVVGYDRYESPADLAHKEEFTARRATELLSDVGFVDISTSLHDFLAYPLSGSYMRSPLSRSARVMRVLSRAEVGFASIGLLRPIWQLLSWRLLVVASRPGAP
jgi:SAM-dependent methyltransferase